MSFAAAPRFDTSTHWMNSDPLSVEALAGNVTLVHFWDYTNVYCVESLPYVKAWHKAYEAHGLRVIGVHTPEFTFASSQVSVHNAVNALGLTYPVMLDNNYVTWDAFQNKLWPSFHVLDAKGKLVYKEEGDTGYAGIEAVILDQLASLKSTPGDDVGISAVRDRDEAGVPLWPVTDDILTGYECKQLGNAEGFEPHRVVAYDPHPGEMEEGNFYLTGKWLNHRYCVAVAKSHDDQEATLVVPYTAAEVNVILNPSGDVGFSVNVLDNGEPLTSQNAGSHIRLGGKGKTRQSHLVVSDPKLYRVIKHKEVRSGLLSLSSRSSGFAIYGVSFVSSPHKEGEKLSTASRALLGNKAKPKSSVLQLLKEYEAIREKEKKESKKKGKKAEGKSKSEKLTSKEKKEPSKKAAESEKPAKKKKKAKDEASQTAKASSATKGAKGAAKGKASQKKAKSEASAAVSKAKGKSAPKKPKKTPEASGKKVAKASGKKEAKKADTPKSSKAAATKKQKTAVSEVKKENKASAKSGAKQNKGKGKSDKKEVASKKKAATQKASSSQAAGKKKKDSESAPEPVANNATTGSRGKGRARKSAGKGRVKGITLANADSAAAEVLRTKAGKRPKVGKKRK